jgi:HSP20 family molecular chaperone IbpA
MTDLTDRSDAKAMLLHDPGIGETQRVPVNVYETTEALVVVAPMPGVMADDVEIVLQGDQLVLRAALRSPAAKRYLLHEWKYGMYERTVTLLSLFRGPVTARLGNGMLALSIAREGTRATGARIHVQPAPADRTTGKSDTEKSDTGDVET